MSQVGCRTLDVLRGRKRLLVVAMKLPCSLYCSLWFLLLLGAGSLLLLVRLQDLSEMVQQQTPGQWRAVCALQSKAYFYTTSHAGIA